MLYLINGPSGKGRSVPATRRKSTKKRPSAKQLAARKKFTAMAKARAAAAKPSSRKKRSTTMAAKRRRKPTLRRTAPKRRTGKIIKSIRSGGKTVSRKRWAASGYRRNPVSRKRSYRRNPFSAQGIIGDVMELTTGAGAALVGGGLATRVRAMIPFTDENPASPPVIEWGKALLVGIGFKFVGRKAKLPTRLVDMAALGAVLFPTKNLLMAMSPAIGAYLGDSTRLPSFPGFGRYGLPGQLANYSANGMADYSDSEATVVEDVGMGAYTEGW